jgi:hypothetical protein
VAGATVREGQRKVTRRALCVSSVTAFGLVLCASSVLTGISSPLMWGMQVKCWRSSVAETSVDFAVVLVLRIKKRFY